MLYVLLTFEMGKWAANFCRNGFLKSKLNEMDFNRTAGTNGPISLASAASLGKCGYGNGIAVMERISGTVLTSKLDL